MENLWAPWRSAYILTDHKDRGCVFCHAVKDSVEEDEKNLLVYRGQTCFCILNKYPYSGGHVMVCPNEHTDDISSMSPDSMVEFMTMIGRAQAVLKKEMTPEGFNIGANFGKAAGAGIKGHFHMHIVPRWVGDVNFMSVTSDARVISMALNDVYKRIKCGMDSMYGM